MPLQQKVPHYSPEEYLEIERQAEEKSEYYQGEVFAMAGASFNHNIIVVNISAAIHRQIRSRSCETYSSDMKVKVKETGLYTYPDLLILGDPPEFGDQKKDILLNPDVIIEVLSPSTEGYDRGAKFEQYRTIPSLKDYVLIAQDKIHLEHYQRQTRGNWLFSEYKDSDQEVTFSSVEVTLKLADLYEKVDWESESTGRSL